MFDLFFMGAFAFNQAMLLLAALFCLGLGGLLIGQEAHWRLYALRVEGTIIGVREKEPTMFRSVYRYSLPSGETFEATSGAGSNSVKGRDTGRRVELLVFADHPEQVREASTAIAGIFGAMLLIIGFWPLHAALTAWPVTPFTWIMLAAGIAYIAHRFRGHIIPKAQRKTPIEWQKERRERNRAELATLPMRRIEDILSSPQAIERRRRDQKTFRVMSPILLLAGAGTIIFGVHLGRDVAQRQATGHRAEGSVVALDEQSGSDSSTYYPVVRFVADGATVEFKDRVGANPPSYRVGEAVPVLYRGDASANNAIIDRGAWNWLPAVLLCLFGSFLAFVSVRLFMHRGE
jgi:hypothetical protein